MAKGVNKVVLLGNLGKPAELRQGGETLIASFSIATGDRVKRNGAWVEETQWHRCVAFGRLAEIIRDYTEGGSKLYVEGRLVHRSWDDAKSGQKRYSTEIIVADVTLLDGPKGGKAAPKPSDSSYPYADATDSYEGDF